jgi:hypothetical protein
MGHNALQFTTRNPKIYCREKCAMLSICFRRVASTLPSNADPLSLKYQLLARLRLDLVLVYIVIFMLLNASAFTFCNLQFVSIPKHKLLSTLFALSCASFSMSAPQQAPDLSIYLSYLSLVPNFFGLSSVSLRRGLVPIS